MVIVFKHKPSIICSSAVAGPLEKRSVFQSYFDEVVADERFLKKTNEQGQAVLITQAVQKCLRKSGLNNLDVDYFLSGDLINQMTPTNFAAQQLAVSFIGMFSACATSVSSVIVAALLTELQASRYAIAGASSHHNATERQFRYPILYGGQKPAYSQWTVTAAGYAVVAAHEKDKPYIASASVGKVVDFKQTDPFHMGAAMAPAAFETIVSHLNKRNQTLATYDVIFTGDLGKVGLQLLKVMLTENGEKSEDLARIRDAGAEFFGEDQRFQAGASGAGCSASVFYSYVLEQLQSGRYKRVLLVATGALLSPLSFQQGETIPCTAHAVEIVMEG